MLLAKMRHQKDKKMEMELLLKKITNMLKKMVTLNQPVYTKMNNKMMRTI